LFDAQRLSVAFDAQRFCLWPLFDAQRLSIAFV